MLTPAELERLALLNGELAEVQQIISKIIRFGYESHHPDDPDRVTNRSLLATELGHVQHALKLLIGASDIDYRAMDESFVDKLLTVKQWLRHQED